MQHHGNTWQTRVTFQDKVVVILLSVTTCWQLLRLLQHFNKAMALTAVCLVATVCQMSREVLSIRWCCRDSRDPAAVEHLGCEGSKQHQQY